MDPRALMPLSSAPERRAPSGHGGVRVHERRCIYGRGEDSDLIDWGFVWMCGKETEGGLEALFIGDKYLVCDAGEFVHQSHDLGCASHMNLNVWTLDEIVNAQI